MQHGPPASDQAATRPRWPLPIVSRLTTAAAGLLVLGSAAYLRLLPRDASFGGDQIRFWGSDAYDHVRRIRYAADHLLAPHMPFDWYLGYPEGAANFWPPLYHWLAALASWIFSAGRPSVAGVEFVAAHTPVAAALLCLVLVYLVGRRIAGDAAGLIAAATLAVSPAHLWQTIVGYPDNNAYEPTLAALLLLCLTAALPERLEAAPATPRLALRGLFAALAGWIALFSWRGSGLLLAVIAAYVSLELTAAAWRRVQLARGATGVGVFGLALALSASPFVALGGWGASNSIHATVISWFHVSIAGAIGLAMLALSCAPVSWSAPPALRWTTLALLALSLISGGIWLASPGYLGSVMFSDGARWGIAEWGGLLFDQGRWRWDRIGEMFGWVAYGLPVLWGGLAYSELRGGLRRPRVTHLLVWTLALLVVAVMRMRFAPLAALAFSLLLGVGAAQALAAAKLRWPSRPAWIPIVLLAAAVALQLVPLGGELKKLRQMNFDFPVSRDLFAALHWMRDNTPRTSPASATPWGDEIHGMKPQARFFLSEDQREADRILRENGARYVLATNTLRYLDDFARMLGRESAEYFSERPAPSGEIVDVPGPRWMHLVSTRLLLNDGNPLVRDGSTQPVSTMRLLWESRGTLDIRGFPQRVSRVKLFERVPGVRLAGEAPPLAPVRAELSLVSNTGRSFFWAGTTRADGEGRFEVRVPYATLAANGSVRADGPYLVAAGSGGLRRVHVTEGAVLGGEKVVVPDRSTP
jgi:dolichyl-diphosphooligosaccharide--protein glycosyltransferase